MFHRTGKVPKVRTVQLQSTCCLWYMSSSYNVRQVYGDPCIRTVSHTTFISFHFNSNRLINATIPRWPLFLLTANLHPSTTFYLYLRNCMFILGCHRKLTIGVLLGCGCACDRHLTEQSYYWGLWCDMQTVTEFMLPLYYVSLQVSW